jgi:hypothetical protein
VSSSSRTRRIRRTTRTTGDRSTTCAGSSSPAPAAARSRS